MHFNAKPIEILTVRMLQSVHEELKSVKSLKLTLYVAVETETQNLETVAQNFWMKGGRSG